MASICLLGEQNRPRAGGQKNVVLEGPFPRPVPLISPPPTSWHFQLEEKQKTLWPSSAGRQQATGGKDVYIRLTRRIKGGNAAIFENIFISRIG